MQVGFTTLRGLVIQRPSMRTEALTVLLELTTHPGWSASSNTYNYLMVLNSGKKTRAAAINSVKMWVPNTQPMDGMVREFALQMLRKLQSQPVQSQSNPPDVEMDGIVPGSVASSEEIGRLELRQDDNMEDGQIPPEALVHTPYLPERIELPAKKAQVLQHVELVFALSVKVPEFLDEYVLIHPFPLLSKNIWIECSWRTARWMHRCRKPSRT